MLFAFGAYQIIARTANTLTGAIVLYAPDSSNLHPSSVVKYSDHGIEYCNGAGGYSDITQGTRVTVKDESGKIIATGSLGEGLLHYPNCEFPIVVTSVPAANFYSVEVSHRGALQYSRDQLKQMGWTVSLSLGQ